VVTNTQGCAEQLNIKIDEEHAGLRTEEPELSGPKAASMNQITIITIKATPTIKR
jgi:hypothetical protein